MSESVAGGTAYKTRRNDIKSGAGFIHSTHGVLDVRAHGFDSRSFFVQELFVYVRGAGDARVVERVAVGGRFGVYLGGVAFHELGEPHHVGADSRRRGVRLDTAVIRRVCHKTTCCSPPFRAARRRSLSNAFTARSPYARALAFANVPMGESVRQLTMSSASARRGVTTRL